MATKANCEENTNTYGELRWQYKLGENASRTFSDKHSRALTVAHGLGQTSFQLCLRHKEYIATWDNSKVLADTQAGGFARLISLEEVVTKTQPPPSTSVVTPRAATTVSAGAQLKQRKLELRAASEAQRGRKHEAARNDHLNDKQVWAQKLADEDDTTKAQRNALENANRTSRQHQIGDKDEGPSDKRSRRIDHGMQYAAGVAAYRARLKQQQNHVEPGKKKKQTAQVLVRARPLFAHEVDRGEWDSISVHPSRESLVVHESAEKIIGRQGLVKTLRHHVFRTGVVTTDDQLYQAVRHLPRLAVHGGRATLFCYGMTGSGKTYSMDSIHRRLPEDLFSLLNSQSNPSNPGLVTFSAYELVGKNCVELLPSSDAASKADGTGKTKVHLREDKRGVTRVCGVAQHKASNPDELLQLLKSAVQRRETSATGANATSSRSHAVYSLSFGNKGRLTLIDLAGSEGNHETLFHSAKHVAEAKEINQSLATLRACLRARSEHKHAPYRESILTRVLKDSLTDPGAAATLLACVSPACTHLEHSLRTVRTSMYLTGDSRGGKGGEEVEEEVLQTKRVQELGPKSWTHAALCDWIGKQQFGTECENNGGGGNGRTVVVPEGMGGKEIMKLSKARLKVLCNGNSKVGDALFAALRECSKVAAKAALERRMRMKNGGKTRTSAAGYASAAPGKPTVAMSGSKHTEQ